MSTIITRNSATSGSVPSSLVQGELAINVTDNRLFFGSGSGNVVKEFGVTASYAIQALSSSFASTASYVNGTVISPGSDTQVIFNNGGVLGANSGFVYSGSNVGIGTSSPAYKLSVAGKLSLVDGVDSIFIGLDAGKNDDGTSNSNIAIGTSASQNNTTGANNIAIGTNTLFSSNVSNNTAIGTNTLRFNTSGTPNTAVGSFSQVSSSTGTFNTSLGTNTLFNNTVGSFHTALGASVLFSLLTGNSNNGIGSGALFSLITGSENNALGRNAGRYFGTGTSALTEASASIFIGFNSRANAVGETNQIVIGNEALGLGSNTVVLGNDNIVTTALKGNIGIGKTNPSTKLDVNGNTTITGSLTVTNGITGSLLGTSSYATTALSASYAITASYVLQAISASFATTASYVNPLNQNVLITGSLTITGSQTISGSLTTTGNITSGNSLIVSGSSIILGAGLVQPNSLILNNSIIDVAVGGNYISRFTRNGYQGFIVANGATIGFSSVGVGGSPMGNSDVAFSRISSNVMALGNGTNGNTSGTLIASTFSGSFLNLTGSATITGSLTVTNGITGSLLGTSSYAINALSASYALNATSASYALTASYVENAQTASYVLNAVSASYAETASYAPLYLPLTGGTISGNVNVLGTASIAFLNVTYESASVIYSSGSNQFGDASNDVQTLWGTVDIKTGPVLVTGSISVSGSTIITGSLDVTQNINATSLTGSLFGTASYASQALSSSFASTASYVLNAVSASYALTASYVQNAQTASYVLNAVSASFASTASYINPLVQNVLITGSLTVSGSSTFTDTIYTNFPTPSATTSILARGFSDGNFQLVTQNGASVSGYGISTTFGMIYNGVGDVAKINFHRGTGTGIGHISISSPLKVGDTSATATSAQLTVKGSGTTSATTALLVQNSNASASLSVLDNGNVGVGTTTAAYRLSVLAPNAGDGIAAYVGSAAMIMTGNNGSGNPGISSTSGVIHISSTINGTGGSEVLNVNKSSNGAYIQAWRSFASVPLSLVDGNGNFAIRRTSATASLDVAGTTRISGSFNTAASGSILTVIGSGSAQPIFTVQGSQGELFSITDSLSGSLFSVNDISGLPILEVFSDNTTLIGNYQDPMLITTTKLVTTASGAFTLYSLPTASYDTAFFEYSIKSGSNARAGTIMAIQLGTLVNFTETTTTDFGSTTGFGLTVQVSSGNMILTGSATTSGWTIKTIVRSI